LGDKKNDHGLYNVTLDNGTAQIYDGISGCGGAFGMTCEQQKPTLAYFASNLDSSLHSLKIVNMAGVNHSFFGETDFSPSLLVIVLISYSATICRVFFFFFTDLESIVLTVPSVYSPRQTSNSSAPPSPSHHNGADSVLMFSMASNPFFLIVLGMLWVLRRM
jgi:hypothetical protein